ncbi:hypothetical protein CR513_08802, partial [Mucuna pruriens]
MGNVIPHVSKFKYFGPIIQNDGEINEHVTHRIQEHEEKMRVAKMKIRTQETLAKKVDCMVFSPMERKRVRPRRTLEEVVKRDTMKYYDGCVATQVKTRSELIIHDERDTSGDEEREANKDIRRSGQEGSHDK